MILLNSVSKRKKKETGETVKKENSYQLRRKCILKHLFFTAHCLHSNLCMFQAVTDIFTLLKIAGVKNCVKTKMKCK